MANWNLPTPQSGYINFVAEMNDKFYDSARMYYQDSINIPIGTIRFNRSGYVFDEWDSNISTWLPRTIGVTGGGTGSNNATGARANLGLGSMATQNSNAVSITGGSITGISFDISSVTTGVLPLARGGTGSSLALGAQGTVLMSYAGSTQFTSGVNITQLDAGALTQGIVPSARLTGVGKLAEQNTWGARNTFNGDSIFSGSSYAWGCTVFASSDFAVFNLYSGNAGGNRKWSRFITISGDLHYQRLNDDYTSAVSIFTVTWDGLLGGNASALYALNASAIDRGLVNPAFLGSGSPSAATYLRGDGVWAAIATGGGGEASPIPSGMIAIFNGGCPVGWTRFSQLDNRFPLGSSGAGATGGSDTHSHQFDVNSNGSGNHNHTFSGSFGGSGSGPINGGGRTSGPSEGTSTADSGNSFEATKGNHFHDFSISGSANVNVTTDINSVTGMGGDHGHRVTGGTNAASHVPFYYTVVFCMKN